jgi:hypothetical protein
MVSFSVTEKEFRVLMPFITLKLGMKAILQLLPYYSHTFEFVFLYGMHRVVFRLKSIW